MQNDQLQEIVSTLNNANNVLVTVKNSPSVDELSAAIGLTLALNKADKHATTVFSGDVPSTIEFLQPESVIETNTDSLRDFIIALDKSKADKLRYKVEDNVVRIFITPYKTSISDADLDFTQGDFNVDAVVALGVVNKEDFDTAITAHGRILHDATVIAVTKQNVVSQVGVMNWQEPRASSVSEMIAAVVDAMNPDILDGQMATAFLTGIVAETDRFKNEKTTPDVLAVSSRLMTAGANQQLIAEKLDEAVTVQLPRKFGADDNSAVDDGTDDEGGPRTKIAHHKEDHDDGALDINHNDEVDGIHIDDNGNMNEQKSAWQPEPAADDGSEAPVESPIAIPESPEVPLEDVSESVSVDTNQPQQVSREYHDNSPSPMSAAPSSPNPSLAPLPPPVSQPSLPGSDMQPAPPEAVVNAQQNPTSPPQDNSSDTSTPVDDMPGPSAEANMPVMQHENAHKVIQPISEEFQPKPVQNPVSGTQQSPTTPGSLADLEKSVGSPHANQQTPDDDLQQHLGSIRSQVNANSENMTAPRQSTGANHVDLTPPAQPQQPIPEAEVAPANMPRPAAIKSTDGNQQPQDPNAPPSVPPPLMPTAQPQFFDADGKNNNPFAAK